MLKRIFAISLIATLFLTTYAATPTTFDVNHSNVSFGVPILGGLAQVTGKFTQFDVNLNFDENDITKSTVAATIKTASIDTGIEGRDKHLRNHDFFEVEKFPEIKFVSNRVEKKGKMMTLTGDFTMHGVTKEISFPFAMIGNCFDKKEKKAAQCGFAATLKIDRRDYGMNYVNKSNADFVGNIIDVHLNLLTRLAKPGN